MLVFYHLYPTNSIRRRFEKGRTMVDYQAALSNACASMAGTEEDTSIQIHAIARDAINSRTNP